MAKGTGFPKPPKVGGAATKTKLGTGTSGAPKMPKIGGAGSQKMGGTKPKKMTGMKPMGPKSL